MESNREQCEKDYIDAVASGLEGLQAVSVGACPGCEPCEEACSDESHFSGSACGICGSHFAGDRYVWHWLRSPDGVGVRHEDDACDDCRLYLANGDTPEFWKRFP